MTESQRPSMPDTDAADGMNTVIPCTESETPSEGGSAASDAMYESDGEILHLLQIIREETKDQLRSDAFSALCTRYRPLTEHMVGKYAASLSDGSVSSADRQELEEEASIALYHAARFYRAGSHATFGYFAGVCIRNRLVSFLRKHKQHTQFCTVDSAVDDDAHVRPGVFTVGDVGELIAEQDAFRAMFDRFLENLTDYERDVFHRYVRGHSYKEIALALNVPLKSVDNAVYRIRVKLKQQLQAEK